MNLELSSRANHHGPLPFVSVIIPVLNGEKTIRDCVASLLRTDYPPERREILVVDNGSTDRTRQMVQAYPVILLQEKRPGAAAARNKGIEASRGEILAFTDADCVLSTGWLRELVAAFDDAASAGAAGNVVPYPSANPVQCYAARTGSHSDNQQLSTGLVPYVITANVAFRREVFQKIGLFDTRFPAAGGEDVDFSWRFFRETGFTLRYAAKAVVFHRHRATPGGLFTQRVSYGYARALLRRKYPAEARWGCAQEIKAYCDLVRAIWRLTERALQYTLTRQQRPELSDLFFEVIARLGFRIGFVRGLLLRGGSKGNG